MSSAVLTVDLDALIANWRALGMRSRSETAAVVKADAYGLGAAKVARALADAGARQFFVATAEEGTELRQVLGPGPEIAVFSGHMVGDTDIIRDTNLVPILNSVEQMLRHVEALPGAPFGIQLDTGMNRLGMEAREWSASRDIAINQKMVLAMSHLACADEPLHQMNAAQLAAFRDMTEGLNVPLSLSATGGILLGADYHFDMTRPGIGLYGCAPFSEAGSVVSLEIPVIQTRIVQAGETVGYGNTWQAPTPRHIATIAAGYADGVFRRLGEGLLLYYGDVACPVVGRISMDMIGVDVTDLRAEPESLQLIGAQQSPDELAEQAGTIGYEILTSLGGRYQRRYLGG